MSLISSTSLKSLTDKVAYLWDRLGAFSGTAEYGSLVAGTGQYILGKGLDGLLATVNYDAIQALDAQAYDAMVRLSRANLAANCFADLLSALDAHASDLGSTVDASVVDLSTLLTYLNATPFSVLLHASFGDAWLSVTGSPLPPAGLSQPSLNPRLNAAAPNGLGVRAVGGSATLGATPSTTYSAVAGCVEVTTTFVGGSAAPTVTVAGVSHLGVSTTWTGTFGSNNPAAAVSTTVTPAVAAASRVTVAVASAAGIVVGSVLCVNAGLADQEYVTVEAVAGSTITAVFDKAHDAGALLTGNTTVALVPAAAGSRIASVTGITINITGHSAGAVRAFGVLDRQHDPS